MAEMRSNYLHQDWEDQIQHQILTSTLVLSKLSFWNWSQHLIKLNCLLHGTTSCTAPPLAWHHPLRSTTSFFDDATLRNHLDPHLDEELYTCLKNNEAYKDKVLKSWIASVHLIDETRAMENKRQCELIEETLGCQAKCQNTTTDTLHRPSCHANTSQSNTTSSASTSTSSFIKLPPLTDNKRTLLNEHDGCTKCCRSYMDHCSQACPDGFPSGKGYKTLTVTDVLAAKKGKAVAKSSAKPVAATSASIEAVDFEDELATTAAILPNTPGKLALDSDEDWDVSCHEVSPILLKSNHLISSCQINSQMDDFPVKTCTLIDNGAHLALICPELVDRLGLKMYCLKEPELVDIAFSNEKKKTKLYHYVKLSLSSLNSAWTSCVIKAVVTPGLCLPIILGLPWLEHNHIVTDHTA